MCPRRTGMVWSFLVFVMLIAKSRPVNAQDYEVSDIQCTFADSSSDEARDLMVAILKKPEHFKGSPLFADDRDVDPENNKVCQIRQDLKDQTALKYALRITDFSRCGVLKRNGYIHVRVWFPQFPGVVMQSDQELIIMCKPPEKTVIENKAAGFAGSFPAGARVSGIVEESPGRLEYEVALYKEAPARISNTNNELPVDQAVPIGTKLQLRARINPDSAWKYVKLMEVTVSPDPEDPHRPGSVALVRNGCKNAEFSTIIPHQPTRYREKYNEVFLDFEAFLLSTMKERSTLWIHSQIKACMDEGDCEPEYCLGMQDTTGHGRRRRDIAPDAQALTKKYNDTSQFTKFSDNIEYSVLMPPGEFFHRTAALESSCSTFLVIATILGCVLFMSVCFVMCWFASRQHAAMLGSSGDSKNIDQLVRESRHFSESGYTGRAMTQ